MAKKKNNQNYLDKLQAQKERDIRIRVEFMRQYCEDAAVIAANKTFHRRGKKIMEFMQCFYEELMKNAQMTNDDAKDDKEMAYTKGKIDEKLKYIVGEENFVPWELRYDIKVEELF